jgi:two-component system, OmpR family, response regulator
MHPSDIKILVVDDEKVVSANLSAFLEDEGFSVLSAASGEEALDMLSEQDVDIGIIDMRLPGIDGNTLILKAHNMHPLMKFLIHTGSTNYGLPQSLMDIGIGSKQVLRKPLPDLSVLTRALDELITGEHSDD